MVALRTKNKLLNPNAIVETFRYAGKETFTTFHHCFGLLVSVKVAAEVTKEYNLAPSINYG